MNSFCLKISFLLFANVCFAQSSTTTTDYFGNQNTTHKDQYGNTIGKSTTTTDYFGNKKTSYKPE